LDPSIFDYCIPLSIQGVGVDELDEGELLDGIWFVKIQPEQLSALREIYCAQLEKYYGISWITKTASHAICIDWDRYTKSLIERLELEGFRESDIQKSLNPISVGIRMPMFRAETMTRQIVTSMMLSSNVFTSFGTYFSRRNSGDIRFTEASFLEDSCVPTRQQWGIFSDRQLGKPNIENIRHFMQITDKYYRQSHWYSDRIAVALNMFWVASSSKDSIQAFLRFTTLLESLISSGSTEITHQLAERVALLLGHNQEQRIAVYNSMTSLYETRSRLVHGSVPHGKGVRTYESLHIDSTWSNAPVSALRKLASFASGVIVEILNNQKMVEILQSKGNDYSINKKIKDFYLEKIMADRVDESA
jgi:hypothetical protein